jgi:predicted dienelactone hydrolase
VRIYYPTSGGPYPVIIFSHGAGGARNVAPALLEYWAAAGYVVIAPTHEDSITMRDGRNRIDGILRSFALDPRVRLSRVEDVKFIIDRLPGIEVYVPQLRGRVDATIVGAGGHSAGAMTAMLLAGARGDMASNGPGGPEAGDVSDGRVRCALVLSGQGFSGGGSAFTEDSWKGVDIPMFVMTGSLDWSDKTRQTVESRQDPYRYAPAGSKYLAVIEGAAHMSFTGRAAKLEEGIDARWIEGYLGGPEVDAVEGYDQEAIFGWIQQSTLAFWDLYLKGDEAAAAFLTSDGVGRLGDGAVHFESK